MESCNEIVAAVFEEAAQKAKEAKGLQEFLEIISRTSAKARSEAYRTCGQSCLSCAHFRRDGERLSGICTIKFVEWAGRKEERYVSQSCGSKCKGYEPKGEK